MAIDPISASKVATFVAKRVAKHLGKKTVRKAGAAVSGGENNMVAGIFAAAGGIVVAGLLALLLVVIAIAGLVGSALPASPEDECAPGADGQLVNLPPIDGISYDPAVAAVLWQNLQRFDASDRVVLATFEAALAETNMKNLSYGDAVSKNSPAESRGVFQQRAPGYGWGTPEQTMDVQFATESFLNGRGGNPGVITLEGGGFSGGAHNLAQAVQRSAFSTGSNYLAKEGDARTLIAHYESGGGSTVATQGVSTTGAPEGGAVTVAGLSDGSGEALLAQAQVPGAIGPPSAGNLPGGVQPVTTQGAQVARDFGFDGVIGGLGDRPNESDHGSGYAIDLMTGPIASRTGPRTPEGQALADLFLANRDALNVKYVIWWEEISSPIDDWAWRHYEHPTGRSDDTADHYDHVHVSFNRDGMGTGEIVGIAGGAQEGCVTTVGADAGAARDGYALPLPAEAINPDPSGRAGTMRPHHDYPAWDAAVPEGTQVFVVAAGTVVSVHSGTTGNPNNKGDYQGSACGNGVNIAGADGVVYQYCHAPESGVPTVSPGETVSPGQPLMKVGSSGSSTGYHLHLGMNLNGSKLCPQTLLKALHEGGTLPSVESLPRSGCSN